MSGVPEERVRAELDRVLAGPAFARVERPGRFLRHLVESTLSGKAQLLKESVLGMDVFGRATSWDPRLDPIVRQEAARLRKRLARHYDSEAPGPSGSGSGIRIELPVGTYVPVFRQIPEPSPTNVPSATIAPVPTSPASRLYRHRWKVVAAGVAAMALAISAVWVLTEGSSKTDQSPNSKPEELYLSGLYYFEKRTPESLQKAEDLFSQAIALNPSYARAYVGLADCYNLLREFAAMPETEAYPRALAATRRALELDDKLAEAHTSLGFITFWWNWNATAAEREFRRAIALNPNYARAHHWYATFLSARERHQEALAQITLAQELDHSSTSILADKGLLLYLAGEKDAAISLLKQLEADKDTLVSTHRYLARIYLDQRDCRNYLAELKRLAAQEKTPASQAVAQAAANGFAAGGTNEMLEQMLVAQLDLHGKGLLPSYRVAETYGLLGRTTEAISYLEESAKEPGSLFLAYRGDPSFRTIRGDPGYRQLDAKYEPFISAGTLPERSRQ